MIIEFLGPVGSGKTSTIKELKKILKSEDYNIEFISARRIFDRYDIVSESISKSLLATFLGFLTIIFNLTQKPILGIFIILEFILSPRNIYYKINWIIIKLQYNLDLSIKNNQKEKELKLSNKKHLVIFDGSPFSTLVDLNFFIGNSKKKYAKLIYKKTKIKKLVIIFKDNPKILCQRVFARGRKREIDQYCTNESYKDYYSFFLNTVNLIKTFQLKDNNLFLYEIDNSKLSSQESSYKVAAAIENFIQKEIAYNED